MYPAISSVALAAALNISSNCLMALNATVDCDQDLFRMAGNADGYFWSDDNATALCTKDCMSSAASWWAQSASACADEVLNAYGRLYPVETVTGRYLDGINIVCLTADTDVTQDVGINGTIITSTVIGGENSTVNGTFSDPQPLPNTPLERRERHQDSSGVSNYCLVQSYDWVGSDIIRPDCDNPANANESQCIDPTDVPAENSRIANLYPNSLLCSQCFLKMFYLRLASPYLPDLDDSDFMADQWYDILDVCNANASMPDLIVRSLPYYPAAPGFSIDGSNNATNSWVPLSLEINGTCPGRLITLADLPEPTIDDNTQPPCDVIAPLLEASTGDVIEAMGTPACLPFLNSTQMPSICLPLACQLAPMPNERFAATLSIANNTANTTVTTTQFLSWNPNLIGLCSNTTAQYVCAGAPGGTYVPPRVNTTTSSAGQQRGGSGGSGGMNADGDSNRNSTSVKPGQTPPTPTQSGILASCTKYAEAETGDGCTSFAAIFGITVDELATWNPVLGVDGANCTTMLEAGWRIFYYHQVNPNEDLGNINNINNHGVGNISLGSFACSTRN
ncbi:hypothetical protein SEUCBS139899_010118 [Sporothrix eucalyptigena]